MMQKRCETLADSSVKDAKIRKKKQIYEKKQKIHLKRRRK
jgi:hypothetical protein